MHTRTRANLIANLFSMQVGKFGACLLAGAVVLCSAALARAALSLTGAGATFPYPMYSKWFDAYHKVHPDIEFNYQSIGSGGGIRQVTAGTVDFGASDGPMTDEQIAAFKEKRDTNPLHFPTVLGAAVPAYNVPGVQAELRFTAEALAGIFLGTVTKWNDPAIASANPGVALPSTNIVVAHRADGSGTTYVWTDYLSKVSPEWDKSVGRGTSVKWPTGVGGKGNEGVAGVIKQTSGCIGYIELIYAVQNHIPYGSVRNASGNFIKADLASVSASAAGVPMPDDFRVSITNSPAPNAYPISSFTWLLIPEKIQDQAKKQAIVDFLHWMLTEGQTMTEALTYAPLPKPVIEKEETAINKIQ
jgi:phosphate transport system substrate-binding protein